MSKGDKISKPFFSGNKVILSILGVFNAMPFVSGGIGLGVPKKYTMEMHLEKTNFTLCTQLDYVMT